MTFLRIRTTAFLFVLTALLAGAAWAQRTPFPDVAPCHWASGAIGEIAGTPEVDPNQARGSVYLVENSLRQVFEGLRCGDLGWSAYFMAGTPDGTGPEGALESYSLTVGGTDLQGDSATVRYRLSAVIDGQGFERDASADLAFDDGRWQVAYASLAGLGLPLFP